MDERELDEYLARQPAAIAVDDDPAAPHKPRGRARGALMGLGGILVGSGVLVLFIISAALFVVIANALGYSLVGFMGAWALMFWALGMGDLRAARAGGGLLDWGGALFGLIVSLAAALGIWSGAQGNDGRALLDALPFLDGGAVLDIRQWR